MRLRSADPAAPPAIQINYLADERDLDGSRRAASRSHDGSPTPRPSPAYRGEELGPGPGGWDEDALHGYIRAHVATFFHPVGTCRMGTDERAVVDAELRVRGVEGLRVIDASVMPDLLSGATHAATVMIAEKGADLLR